mgnify:CR=1 FL=1
MEVIPGPRSNLITIRPAPLQIPGESKLVAIRDRVETLVTSESLKKDDSLEVLRIFRDMEQLLSEEIAGAQVRESQFQTEKIKLEYDLFLKKKKRGRK